MWARLHVLATAVRARLARARLAPALNAHYPCTMPCTRTIPVLCPVRVLSQTYDQPQSAPQRLSLHNPCKPSPWRGLGRLPVRPIPASPLPGRAWDACRCARSLQAARVVT